MSVYCDWVRSKVWSAASISVWQHVNLSTQIRPWDTPVCCLEVMEASKQPTDQLHWLRVSRSVGSITCWDHVLAHFSSDQDKTDTTWNEYYLFKGNNCCFTVNMVKTCHFGLCLDIYEPVSFKFGMMLVITKLCIFIPVWMTLTFIQSHRDPGKANSAVFLSQVLVWF